MSVCDLSHGNRGTMGTNPMVFQENNLVPRFFGPTVFFRRDSAGKVLVFLVPFLLIFLTIFIVSKTPELSLRKLGTIFNSENCTEPFPSLNLRNLESFPKL